MAANAKRCAARRRALDFEDHFWHVPPDGDYGEARAETVRARQRKGTSKIHKNVRPGTTKASNIVLPADIEHDLEKLAEHATRSRR